VTVRLSEGDMIVVGQGAHMDIIIASALAYVNALNRIEHVRKKEPVDMYR
jgi:2-isopropylmalate synthase